VADQTVLISCRLVWEAEDDVRARLESLGIEVDMPRYEGQQLEEADLLPIIGEYDGILAGDDHLTRRVLEAAPRLKVISKWGIGVDAIDRAAAAKLGIAVYNTPGVFGDELADYAMGYIHMLARRQHEVNARVKAGEWHKVRGVSLAGKTLGIVGLGSSGRALARRGMAASMGVIGCDVVDVGDIGGCEVMDLESLLRTADIVTLHAPATPQTSHMINADTLTIMKDGVWLINISRGSLVDEAALADALRRGKVGGAALDVFETEPVSIENELLSMDNVIVGSHNGSNTREAVERTTWMAVDNLLVGLGVGTS
jgi:D-3-phosphoglycerate dehydrogenase / 2-oxoglutarate reductase